MDGAACAEMLDNADLKAWLRVQMRIVDPFMLEEYILYKGEYEDAGEIFDDVDDSMPSSMVDDVISRIKRQLERAEGSGLLFGEPKPKDVKSVLLETTDGAMLSSDELDPEDPKSILLEHLGFSAVFYDMSWIPIILNDAAKLLELATVLGVEVEDLADYLVNRLRKQDGQPAKMTKPIRGFDPVVIKGDKED